MTHDIVIKYEQKVTYWNLENFVYCFDDAIFVHWFLWGGVGQAGSTTVLHFINHNNLSCTKWRSHKFRLWPMFWQLSPVALSASQALNCYQHYRLVHFRNCNVGNSSVIGPQMVTPQEFLFLNTDFEGKTILGLFERKYAQKKCLQFSKTFNNDSNSSS